MNITIRLATQSDSEAIRSIYAPIVQHSHTSFEYEVPGRNEFWARIEAVLAHRPWLVATADQQVLGYSYATQVRGRIAYSWSSELSVYVHPDFQGIGIGEKLYRALIELLKLQGTRNLYGVIALPNEESELFHRKLGFKKIAEFEDIGFKSGKWHTIAWYYLREGDSAPPPIFRELKDFTNSAEYTEFVTRHETVKLLKKP